MTALTVFHFFLAAVLPASEDELYYWVWAQQLSPSYFDHPPLVAYLIRLSTAIFGDSLFGIRFFAVVMGTAVIYFCSRMGEARRLLSLLLLTPLFFFGSVWMTPDIPLVFFWSLYVLWLSSVNRTMQDWSGDPVTRVYRTSPVSLPRWMLGGLVLGLGLMSKYTMWIAIPCAFFTLAGKYRWKAWSAGFVAHLVVALLVGLPVLIFNFRHGFAPYRFQWEHVSAGSGSLMSFLGSQIAMVGALPFLMLPFVLLEGRDLRDQSNLRVPFFFFVLPILFFLIQGSRAKVEANWPIVAYLSCWALAQRILDQSSFRGAVRGVVFLSFAFPIGLSALLIAHLLAPLKLIPPHKDRIGRLSAMFTLSERLAVDGRDLSNGATVVAPSYQWVSYLRYRGLPAEQAYPAGRVSHYTLTPTKTCDQAHVLALVDANAPGEFGSCFTRKEVVREYPLVVRGQEMGRLQWVRLDNRKLPPLAP